MRARWVAAVLMVALAASLALAFTRTVPFSTRAFLYDFRAFACAGRVVAMGKDPYHVEPLRSCEHTVGPFRTDLANLTVPAPLPGFAFAPFVLLSHVPYALAAALWFLLGFGALVVTGFALVQLSGLPAKVVWPLLLLPGCLSLFMGQLVIVALAALVLAAYALERRRYGLAALGVCVAALEPHVALPALIAVVVFVPRTRFTLAGLLAVGVILSLSLLGPDGNAEYVRTVLPAHTASELANEEQYSLAFALHQFGFGDQSALLWGDISYVFAVMLGVYATHMLVRRGAPNALYVLLPPAFAVLAGPYVHIHHMAFAIPAAAVLLGRVLPGNRALAFALVLLAIPWGAFAQLLPALPLVAAIVAILARELLGARPPVALLIGLGACSCLLLLDLSLVARPDASVVLAPFSDGSLMPEAGWKAYIDAGFHANLGIFVSSKVPTLGGLLLLAGVVCRAAFRATPRRWRVAA